MAKHNHPQQAQGQKMEPVKAFREIYRVACRTCSQVDVRQQEKIINEMAETGYEHYESVAVFGGEMILRFRHQINITI